MTDTPTEPTPDDEPADDASGNLPEASPTDDTDNTGTADDHPPPRNREEQYRKRARAAEVELTLARARVSEMNRERAEEHAKQRGMADPSDLWLNGIELGDVLNDDKLVDPAKIDAAVTALLARKPHLARRGPATPPASTVRGDGKPPGAQTAPKLEDAFTPGQG
jgi:hypothetical protein